ncbi:MAG: cytochrome c [Ignavibacteriota bacterium]
MIKKYFLISLNIFSIFLTSLNAQDLGAKLFTKNCTACHTIGGGKLVGPDLSNVQSKQTEEWIIKFVQSSQTVIKSGDTAAVALFNEYNKVIMPDQPLKANEITEILKYIAANSPDSTQPNKKTPNQIFNASMVTDLDIERGRKIFEGTTKLTNNGPPCITCHNGDDKSIIGGGTLALDLTTAFTRLSAAGVDGIVRNPPFPAMINSFGKAPLTDQEVQDLLAFLNYTNDRGVVESSVLQTHFILIVGAFVGLNFVLAIFFFMWQRVKKYSVNNNR